MNMRVHLFGEAGKRVQAGDLVNLELAQQFEVDRAQLLIDAIRWPYDPVVAVEAAGLALVVETTDGMVRAINGVRRVTVCVSPPRNGS